MAEIKYPHESKSQKAKGMLALRHHLGSAHVLQHTVYSLPLSNEDRQNIVLPLFVRPCPSKPRHGFVDSRMCYSEDELTQVETETLAEDSLGEFILMPFIHSRASMILTPTSCAIGPSHDGATQGSGATVLPLTHVKFDTALKTEAGITTYPFLEAVEDSTNLSTYAVQLRDGIPDPPRFMGVNYVEQDTVITHVYNAVGDACEFERMIADAKPGSVLHHPDGNLLSHWAMHARLKGLPILMQLSQPNVGDTLYRTLTSTPPAPNVKSFRRGLEVGADVYLADGYESLLQFALVAIHQSVDLATTKEGGFLVGVACAILIRLAHAAIVGEYRHVRKGRNRQPRHHVYKSALESFTAYWTIRPEALRAETSFKTSSRWRSGYGGPKWGECAESTRLAEKTIVEFIRFPSVSNLKAVTASANNLVNCAHNNGPFLSKFVSKGVFDQVAAGYVVAIMDSLFVGYQLYRTHHERSRPEILKRWRSARINGTRTIAVKPTPAGTLQFSYRADGQIYHFQYGKHGVYKSCDIDKDRFTAATRTALNDVGHYDYPTTSFAGGQTRYFRLINKNGSLHPKLRNLDVLSDLMTPLKENWIMIDTTHMVELITAQTAIENMDNLVDLSKGE